MPLNARLNEDDMPHELPSLDDLKQQARGLRRSLAERGQDISHAASLEHLARQLGYRDWNTLHAAVGNRPKPPFQLGQRISGTYLGQDITGEIIGLRSLADGARHHLTLRFDAAVDVVTFEGMTNFRLQVQVTVDRKGETFEKTSDGIPHLRLVI